MLVLAAASVRADDLQLDAVQDELLGGEYYPNNSNSFWYIKFSAKVEGEDIVSTCEIWTRNEGYVVEVTALKIPYRNMYTSKIDQMHARVISAAKRTAQLLTLTQLLPATADDIAEALWDMAEGLAKKTADMGSSQVRFAVMYHSIIIRAALRIMNGAKQTKDICQVSPDYEYIESNSLFICTQDLPHWNQSLLPHKSEQRFTRSNSDDHETGGSGMNNCSQYKYGLGLNGDDPGCCGNYEGCCRYASGFCYAHDRACTCCKHWLCLWGCRCDSHCKPVEYPDCD